MEAGGDQVMNVNENKEVPVGIEVQKCSAYATAPVLCHSLGQILSQSTITIHPCIPI